MIGERYLPVPGLLVRYISLHRFWHLAVDGPSVLLSSDGYLKLQLSFLQSREVKSFSFG